MFILCTYSDQICAHGNTKEFICIICARVTGIGSYIIVGGFLQTPVIEFNLSVNTHSMKPGADKDSCKSVPYGGPNQLF